MFESLDQLKALTQSLYRVKSRAEYLEVTRTLLIAIDNSQREAAEIDNQIYALTKENGQLKSQVRKHNVLSATRENYKMCKFASGGFYLGLKVPSDELFPKLCPTCFENGSISPLHNEPPYHQCFGCNSRVRSEE